MSDSEKQQSVKALDAVRKLREFQNIFSNISEASEKYQNVQAYVIWRMA